MTSFSFLSPGTYIPAALVAGAVTAFAARRMGRNPFLWFFIGAFFGLLLAGGALFLLYKFPTKNRPAHSKSSTGDLPAGIKNETLPLFFEKNEWYYLNESHQQQGPVPFASLKTSWKQGNIVEKTYVWSLGMEAWRVIRELPQLHASLEN